MKDILNKLYNQELLSREEAKNIQISIGNGAHNDIQIAAFLSALNMRTVSIDELLGFRDAMLQMANRVDLSTYNPIDIVGTGGDGKNTFNISTLSSFVTAGAGVKVAKHGNKGVSSVSGSSNVLETVGVKFTNDETILKKELDEANICFLYAPLFHPSMKYVAPARAALKVKTFFNIMGPMVNPCDPQRQNIGVFNLATARTYYHLFKKLDKQFKIVYALDGYDEVSLTDAVKIFDNDGEHLYNPEDIGLSKIMANEIYGGETIEEAAGIFIKIIEGKGTKAQNNVVFANAGLAISTSNNIDWKSGVSLAKESLLSGAAKDCLEKLITISNNN